MQRERKLLIGKVAAIMATIPILLWAHAAGPDIGKANVPGESNCTESGCHVGTALNGGPGSVKVTFPGGLTYVPGVKQHLMVTIADPAQKAWGFQLTARVSGNTKTPAGSFTSTDKFTAVVCGPTNLNDGLERYLDFGQNQNCAATIPLAYIEHTLAGSSRLTLGSQTYEFDWTPPATNVGNVVIYVAGNAANGNGNETGDHIYTNTYTLTPGAAGPTPTVTGVSNAAGNQNGVFPATIISIYGTNLAPSPDCVNGCTWDKFFNANGTLNTPDGKLSPTLNGVSVTVGGKPAYIIAMVPSQINALCPDAGTGSMQVVVTTPIGTSAGFTVNGQSYAPAFWPWPNSQPVATHGDFSIAAKSGTFPSATVAAKPGEVITLWGTGFGVTKPAIADGALPGGSAGSPTATPVSVTLNSSPVQVLGAAISGFPGDYQVAILIPANMADGDYDLVATMPGQSSPKMTLTVKK